MNCPDCGSATCPGKDNPKYHRAHGIPVPASDLCENCQAPRDEDGTCFVCGHGVKVGKPPSAAEVPPMTPEEVERFRAANAATVFPDRGYLRLLATIDVRTRDLDGARAEVARLTAAINAVCASAPLVAPDMDSAYEGRNAGDIESAARNDEAFQIAAKLRKALGGK